MGRRAVSVVFGISWIVLGGCLEPDLARCGDLLCPSTTVCLDDRCVTPGQLASCAGELDGASCAVNERVGVCTTGVCDFVGCGNGVVESGELCDDANLNYGDGCSADCRSREICGNGIVDFALGETCDCGTTDATRPDRCAANNSASESAECTPDCHLRYCGDGALNVLEQCDGSSMGDASCAGYGYYHGSLACSDGCLVEVGLCYGRCGDADIEPAFGEFCDGGPPPGSCLTYGFDAGYVDCSSACSPDTFECERFGVIQLESRPVLSVATTLLQTAIVSSITDGNTNAWMTENGLRILAPAGMYTVAAATDTVAFVIGATQMAEWSSSHWTVRPVGWSSGTPLGAWLTATGLYVAVSGTVWRYSGGVWTDQTLAGIIGVSGSPAEVFAWSASTVQSTTGSGWTIETLPPSLAGAITAFARGASGPTWLGAGTKIYRLVGTTWTAPSYFSGAIRSAHASTTGDLVAATSSGAFRWPADSATLVQLTLGNLVAADVRPDGEVRTAGANGASAIRTLGWGFYDVIQSGWAYDPYKYDRFNRLTINSNNQASMYSASNYAVWFGEPGVGFEAQDRYLYDLIDAIVLGGDASRIYIGPFGMTDGYSFNWDANLYDGDGILIETRALTNAVPGRDGSVIAASFNWIMRLTSVASPVQEIPIPGYDVQMLGDDNKGTVAAIAWNGNDELRLIRVGLDGVVTDVAQLPWYPSDFWVGANGDVVATGNGQLFRCAGSTCTTESVPANLSQVSGTSLTDLFVVGVWNAPGFGLLTHWDGIRWTPVRVPTASISDIHVTATEIHYVNGGTGIYSLRRVARW